MNLLSEYYFYISITYIRLVYMLLGIIFNSMHIDGSFGKIILLRHILSINAINFIFVL